MDIITGNTIMRKTIKITRIIKLKMKRLIKNLEDSKSDKTKKRLTYSDSFNEVQYLE